MKFLFANTKDADLFYRVRVVIPDPVFFIEKGKRGYIFLDKREADMFLDTNTDPSIEMRPLEPYIERAARSRRKGTLRQKVASLILEEFGSSKKDVISVPASFPLDLADYLRKRGVSIDIKTPFYQDRRKKSDAEKGFLRRSMRVSEKVQKRVKDILKESVVRKGKLFYEGVPLTSEYVKREAAVLLARENFMSLEGIIVSCGKQASAPHHMGSGQLCADQTIVVDVFPRDMETGYFGDITRTFVKGTASDTVKKMYRAVLRAQKEALALLKPGVPCRKIHARVASVLEEEGFDVGEKGFIHGTGHGLGLEVHESPFISARSDDVLKEGDVVTIEPGLYYPEHGGVRIEDVAYVTSSGYRNLTTFPKGTVEV